MVQSLSGRITGIKGTDFDDNPDIPRTALVTETKAYHIGLETFRVWDAMQTNLAGAEGSADDLFLNTGTWATDVISVQTRDSDGVSTTQRAGFSLAMPAEYVSNGTATIRFDVGMLTTVADTSATIDLEVYICDYGLVSGSDLVTTSAIDINADTIASSADFALTTSSLLAGSQIMCRVTIAIVDGGSGAAVIGKIGQAQLLCQIKG